MTFYGGGGGLKSPPAINPATTTTPLCLLRFEVNEILVAASGSLVHFFLPRHG